jgi:hypothetical protein
MSPEFAWQITGALVVLLAILVGFFWFRTPVIFFGRPKDLSDQEFLSWWHLSVEIKPRFFQRKLIRDCAISAYIHGGGVGTIVSEVDLCWETEDGPHKTANIERNRKYFVPVSLRSTYWTTYSVEVNRKTGLLVAVPPRIAFFCDQRMMLAGRLPMHGLSNEYYLSFRVQKSGKTLQRSPLYKLGVPFPRAENSEFTFEK